MKWGILSTGKIAGKFAGQLADTNHTLSAVASRRRVSAESFCARYGGAPVEGYEQLLARDDVDAVYISLPNSLHHAWSVQAMRAGKHVLCEKPIAANAEEAEAMFAAARETKRVLVEAFMYRAHPAIHRLLQLVREGAIGDVRLIRSNFTFQREPAASDVRYQGGLAGGALMDVGCYCINFARAVAGREPNSVHAIAHQHPFGVEDYAAGTLNFGGETLAVFTCGMTVQADRHAFIGGQDGYLQIDTPWFSDGEFQLVRPDGAETIRVTTDKGPYALEAEAFGRVVEGEPPWITHDDTLGNMRVLDQLRKQIG